MPMPHFQASWKLINPKETKRKNEMNQMADNDLQSSVEKENSPLNSGVHYVARKTHICWFVHIGQEKEWRPGHDGGNGKPLEGKLRWTGRSHFTMCVYVADRLLANNRFIARHVLPIH
jgi:hypothetical protein